MSVLLWDLDGTLTNPSLGIVRSIQYAMEKSGQISPEFGDLLWVIGPPIQEIFMHLIPHSSEAEIWDLIGKYRERYGRLGIYENEIYPEIPKVLSQLKEKTNYICTSKPHLYANQIVEHFNLASHFSKVYGAELDGRLSNKGELIELILKQNALDPKEVTIIGDRKYDILGAKRAGINSIGVTWGFGSKNELREAQPDYLVEKPTDLLKIL